jgi:hypothetical protein
MIALAASSNQATTPVTCPLPNPRTTYSSSPPADGYRAPNLANEYPCSTATAPAMRNESQTAAPATSPAAPSSAKIPAPTMAPTPMKAACRTDSRAAGSSLTVMGTDYRTSCVRGLVRDGGTART